MGPIDSQVQQPSQIDIEKEDSQIDIEKKELNKEVCNLEGLIGDLDRKLSQVTTCILPRPVEDNKKSDGSELVILAASIKCERERISTINFFIRGLLDRIQI